MGIVFGYMLIFVLVLVLVLWLVLAFVLAFVLALVLALELVLVASASIWHLAASGLAASGSIWDHLWHLGSSGSIWEHLAASGGIWQHLNWQHPAASGILRQHLAASGGIWQHLAASGIIWAAPQSDPSSGGWKSSPGPEIKPWRPEIEKQHPFLWNCQQKLVFDAENLRKPNVFKGFSKMEK